MFEAIKSILPKIQHYSLELDKRSLLYQEPWVHWNHPEGKAVKLIFQKDGRLHYSVEGDIIDGSWELLNTAGSIIIEAGGQKKLYNHGFLDKGVMILKVDGASSNYFVLANSNVIPDLDVNTYLRNKYVDKVPIDLDSPKQQNTDVSISVKKPYKYELIDGSFLYLSAGVIIGSKATLNGKPAKDGFYQSNKIQTAIKIKKGKVIERFTKTIIKLRGQKCAIVCKSKDAHQRPTKNDYIFFENNERIKNGWYRVGLFGRIKIEDSKIVKSNLYYLVFVDTNSIGFDDINSFDPFL